MEKDMENRIRRALTEDEPVSEQAADRMVLLARMQWNTQDFRKRIGFMDLLLSQLWFAGWKMWVFELIIAAAPTLLIIQYAKLHVITPVKAAFSLSCLAVGISMLWIVFIYRSSYYRMMEIEAVSYFSIKRLLLSRILILFVGELAVITGISIVTSAYLAFGFRNGMAYMLFFLGVCGNGILFMLRTTETGRVCRYFLTYGILLFIVLLLLFRFLPQFFYEELQTWIALGSFILFGYYIYQGFLIGKQRERTTYA